MSAPTALFTVRAESQAAAKRRARFAVQAYFLKNWSSMVGDAPRRRVEQPTCQAGRQGRACKRPPIRRKSDGKTDPARAVTRPLSKWQIAAGAGRLAANLAAARQACASRDAWCRE